MEEGIEIRSNAALFLVPFYFLLFTFHFLLFTFYGNVLNVLTLSFNAAADNHASTAISA